jgi:D-ribose pyranase
MKKTPLLNVALSRVVAGLGHGDIVVIGDAGLPVPPGVELIDLALTPGIPDFASVLRVVLSEMQVERHVLAEEILRLSRRRWWRLNVCVKGVLGPRELLTHAEFKVLCRQARAVVRTGECKPYSNIAWWPASLSKPGGNALSISPSGVSTGSRHAWRLIRKSQSRSHRVR